MPSSLAKAIDPRTEAYPRTAIHDAGRPCPGWCHATHEEAEEDPFAKAFHHSLEACMTLTHERGSIGLGIYQIGTDAPRLLLEDWHLSQSELQDFIAIATGMLQHAAAGTALPVPAS